jgi:hypothetical protein
MEGNGNGRNHVRPGNTDARRGSGNRDGERPLPAGIAAVEGIDPSNGGVRSTVQELRRRAELARAIEPPAARRYIIDLAIGLGRDTREVATWTYGDAYYIVRQTNERLARQGRRHGTRR